MKIAKLAAVIVLAFVLTAVVVGAVAAAPAGSNRTLKLAASIKLLDDPSPTVTGTVEPPEPAETPELTTTAPVTQPVAMMLSLFFNVPYTQVMQWHTEGLGFGVIARAYFIAKL